MNYVHRLTFLVPVLWHCIALSPFCRASSVPFNNLDQFPTSRYVAGDTGDLFAQQFMLGEETTIKQIELGVSGFGNPIGEIKLELWSDIDDLPGERLAEIGSLQQLISFDQSLTIPSSRDDTLVIDTVFSGLSPNQPYYIVLSFADVEATFLRDSAAWYFSINRQETINARSALIMSESFNNRPVTEGWYALDEILWVNPRPISTYFMMRVVTVPDPSGAALATLAIALSQACRRQRHIRPT